MNELIWRIGGMILAKETGSIQRKFNRSHPDVFVLVLKIRISQNTSILCRLLSVHIFLLLSQYVNIFMLSFTVMLLILFY